MYRVDVRGEAVTKLAALSESARKGILDHLNAFAAGYQRVRDVAVSDRLWTQTSAHRLFLELCDEDEEGVVAIVDLIPRALAPRI
jgi:hypothetical protein